MALWRLPAAALLVLVVALPLLWLAGRGTTPDSARLPATAARAEQVPLPLAFEPNARRGPRDVHYISRGAGYTLGLTDREAVLSLAGARMPLRTRLVGAQPAQARAESKLPGVVNEYRGDRSRWRSGIPTFGRVRYASVYPGVDLVYHGTEGRLEYDFELAPGANARAIGLSIAGAKR